MTDATTLLVATTDGLLTLGSARRHDFEGHDVIAIDNGLRGVWAIVDELELWHLDASSWKHVATFNQRARCIQASRAAVLVGTANAHLLRLIDHDVEVVQGFEKAEGREHWYTPWGGPPDVRSLAQSRSGTLLAGVHVGGVLRSEDDGETWRQTIDIHVDVHEVATGNGRVFAATARGLAIQEQADDEWTFERDGLHATYARAVAVADHHVLMSVSDGPRGGHAAVYRRDLRQDGPFHKCKAGLPSWFDDNIDTGCLVGSGSRVAFGTHDGRLFVSDDLGSAWTQAASGLPPVRWLRFANA